MLIKNNQFNSFLDNANSLNGFLVYGPDNGQVRHRSQQIVKALLKQSSADIVKVSSEDLENNSFIDLINQTNIFSNKLIINLNLDIVPLLNLDLSFFSKISSPSANFVSFIYNSNGSPAFLSSSKTDPLPSDMTS